MILLFFPRFTSIRVVFVVRCTYVSILIYTWTNTAQHFFFLFLTYVAQIFILYNGALFSTISFCGCCCCFFSSFCFMYQLLYSTRAIILKYSIQRCSVIELIIKNGIQFVWLVFVIVFVCVSLSFVSTVFFSLAV